MKTQRQIMRMSSPHGRKLTEIVVPYNLHFLKKISNFSVERLQN